MDAARRKQDVTRRANQLYWTSDESVNQIAESLDLSKSAFYGMIGPLMSGSGCPICGAEVEFANRTARDRDELSCPACSWEGAEAETVPLGPDVVGANGSPGARAETAGDELSDSDRRRIIAGSALIGAAVGLVLFTYLRRGD
ncbi:MAG: hypothetical protein LC667_18935 [Thioalkalivibrio sp.]|nr:hypothetical protein [Thioalkalivibrio sp.]